MPEGISNYVTPVNYRNPCIARGNDFLYESTVSDIICLTSEPKSVRHQMDYEVRPEVSKVEDSIPSTRVREIVKTLESDSLVSYGRLPVVEGVSDIIIEWLPTEDMNILARRTQFLKVPFRGASWSLELTLPTSVFGKWFTEYVLDAQFEDIADDACIEFCDAHGLISDLRKCINQAKDIFSNRQNLMAKYGRYPIDEYEEEGHIIIRVEVDSDQDTAFREYDKFVGWMLDTIADENLDFFVLTVNRIE